MKLNERNKVFLLVIIFFLLAFGARLTLLELRPIHHDEGVNGHFVSGISEGTGWNYDPVNYHGPTLFYITAVSFFVFGESIFGLRIVTALFGSLLVFLPLLFRKELGLKGVAFSSFALAFSSALFYYSVFAIHEILFVFFSFFSLAFFFYFEKGREWSLIAGGFCLAMLYASKEAAFFIGPFILLLAIIYWNKKKAGVLVKSKWVIASVLVFILVYSALFTSFYSNPKGIMDSFATVNLWGPRVLEEKGHDKPFEYYSELLLRYESVLLVFGLVGIVYAWGKRNLKIGLLALFFVVLFFGISAVPYKTPWIVMNFLPALALLSGYAFRNLLKDKMIWTVKANAVLLFVVVVLGSCYYVNVEFPASGTENKLVYVQTSMAGGSVLRELSGMDSVLISIDNGSSWPLPWLLRKQAKYYGADSLENSDFLKDFNALIVSREKAEIVRAAVPEFSEKEFDLRPGMPLNAFIAPK